MPRGVISLNFFFFFEIEILFVSKVIQTQVLPFAPTEICTD